MAIIQTFGNQQNRIGAGGAGLKQLIGIENKIFSQERPIDVASDLNQIIEAPLKVRLVGQYANAGRTVGLIDFGDVRLG